jgi:branched-chain amino acid transport system ATP-binding protein
MAILEVKDLVVHYGSVRALKGISFEVEEGSITTILGSNGAGKSTLLNTIAGLVSASSGKIYFRGKIISDSIAENNIRMGLCLVPEGKRLFPYLTVVDNLKMGAFIRKDKREIEKDIERIFDRFPVLRGRKKFQAGDLSGGEQQMLAVARGLMAKPKLLMLDEPTMGIAPIIVGKILETIQEIRETGVTIILVEQNISHILDTADKGFVLEQGRLVLEGDTKVLMNNERVREAYLGK